MDRPGFRKRHAIYDFLTEIGLSPVKSNKIGWLFFAPYRNGDKPSLWVERKREVWRDLSTGQYGDIEDLGVACYGVTDLKETMSVLQKVPTSFKLLNAQSKIVSEYRTDEIEKLDVSPLSDWKLIDFVQEHCIDIELARHYCVEVKFAAGNGEHLCIGFENRSGGYELKNKYFQCRVSPPDITVFASSKVKGFCYVFYQFFDFLSFLTLHLAAGTITYADEMDFLILNSFKNLDKAIPVLIDYEKVTCCLPNDKNGEETTMEISRYNQNVHDASEVYAGYKDFNEFLIAERHKRKEI